VFFTESRYYVTVSSVTSPGHVTDIYVYTAPSVAHYDAHHDVIICRLANVNHNDKELTEAAWPFTLSPSNDDDDDVGDNYYYNNNNTVSLYVKSRDVAAESRDLGLYQSTNQEFLKWPK